MTNLAFKSAVILVLTSFLAIGCCQKEKQQLAALQNDYNALAAQNDEFRSQLNSSETVLANHREEVNQMELQLQQARQDLTSANNTIRDLKTELAAKPTQAAPSGDTAKGWEKGLVGDKVTVGSDILFSSGSAKLTKSGRDALSQIADDLKREYSGLPVRVYGYTDSDKLVRTKKIWTDNLGLSAGRALAVSRYLIEQGVDRDRIETIAMGATNFVTTNATKEGKAKNRRVEIIAVKK
ncbi:MAG: OmpA family protein [Phycisphaerae bacterium]